MFKKTSAYCKKSYYFKHGGIIFITECHYNRLASYIMRTFYAFHLEEHIQILDKCWNYDLLRIIDGRTFSVIICVSLIQIETVHDMRDF